MRYQFKLSALLFALFYAAGLSALTVRFAGSEWLTAQTVAAYATIMSVTLALFFASRGKFRWVAYLLLAPLLFTAALVAASMFSPFENIPITTGVPATNPPPLAPTPLTAPNR